MSEEEEEGGDIPSSTPVDETPTDNPLDEMGVVLSFPRTVQIEMVEARSLGDYELWFGIASLLLSTTTGFFISWLEAWQASPPEKTATLLLVVTVIFGAMTAAAGVVTLVKRRRIAKDRQQVTFKVGRVS